MARTKKSKRASDGRAAPELVDGLAELLDLGKACERDQQALVRSCSAFLWWSCLRTCDTKQRLQEDKAAEQEKAIESLRANMRAAVSCHALFC